MLRAEGGVMGRRPGIRGERECVVLMESRSDKVLRAWYGA